MKDKQAISSMKVFEIVAQHIIITLGFCCVNMQACIHWEPMYSGSPMNECSRISLVYQIKNFVHLLI